MRGRQIKISEPLFELLCKYFLLCDTEQKEQIEPEICERLQEKYQSWERRQLYSQYKTAPTPEEREAARSRYLDAVGMKKEFRY